MGMNNRDRFRAILHFERVDPLPRFEWATWWDLAPTHQLQDNSPTENVLAMYEAARRFGTYR
jgi:Lon protease-like protein